MMCYYPSGYIIFTLRKLKFYWGRGLGARYEGRITQIPKKKAWLQKRENFDDIHTAVKDLFYASLKFKSGNIVKSTKSNFKEEELEAVVCRCSSK